MFVPLLAAMTLAGCGPQSVPGGVEVVPSVSLPRPGEVRVISVTPIPEEILPISSGNFAEDPASWKWRAPRPGIFVQERGVVFGTERGGPGPKYIGPPLDISAVTAVRVRITAVSADSDDENAAIPWVGFYWARSEDLGGDEWPFSNERRIELRKALEDPSDPVWIGRLQGHPMWNGQLEQAFVATNFTKDPAYRESGENAPRYMIAVQSIDLVRTRPMKNWEP